MKLEGTTRHPRVVPVNVVAQLTMPGGGVRYALEGLFCPECGSPLEEYGSSKLGQYRCILEGHYTIREDAFTHAEIFLTNRVRNVEVMDSITFSMAEVECVIGVLERMDDEDWVGLWKEHRGKDSVSLLEVCQGDVALCQEMLDDNKYSGFME